MKMGQSWAIIHDGSEGRDCKNSGEAEAVYPSDPELSQQQWFPRRGLLSFDLHTEHLPIVLTIAQYKGSPVGYPAPRFASHPYGLRNRLDR
jgi:hypothetical protein